MAALIAVVLVVALPFEPSRLGVAVIRVIAESLAASDDLDLPDALRHLRRGLRRARLSEFGERSRALERRQLVLFATRLQPRRLLLAALLDPRQLALARPRHLRARSSDFHHLRRARLAHRHEFLRRVLRARVASRKRRRRVPQRLRALLSLLRDLVRARPRVVAVTAAERRERAPRQRRARVPRAPAVANRATSSATTRPVVSRSTIRDRARVRAARVPRARRRPRRARRVATRARARARRRGIARRAVATIARARRFDDA